MQVTTSKLMTLAALVVVAACVPRAAPPPVPPRQEPPPRPAPPLPPPPPPATDWREQALTPGTWTYAAGSARFGLPGAPPLVTMSCEVGAQRILLNRSGAGGSITVRTTSTARTLPASAGVATLAARDPLLDAIAFSRGRFAVEGAGATPLVLPAWAEPARVIEECRR